MNADRVRSVVTVLSRKGISGCGVYRPIDRRVAGPNLFRMSLATSGQVPPSPTPADPPIGAVGVARVVAGDIKLAHSVFALPFAVLGAFLARDASPTDGRSEHPDWGRFAGQLALVVVCMVLARTWAMVVNRLADRSLDARNPRTRNRAFASGRLSFRAGVAVLVACNLLFVGAASLFWFFFRNPWPVILAEPVLLWIAFYSFTKRFTWLCHVFLGGALAASPLAAALAVNPAALSQTPALWFLAGMVVLWVGGFDIIYALQDTEVDRAEGLWSVPSRLGVPAALWLSRAMHGGAAAMLVLAWRSESRFGVVFAVGVAAVMVLLATEHVVLAKRGKAGLDMAFFTINGVVSCALGVAGCIDLLV